MNGQVMNVLADWAKALRAVLWALVLACTVLLPAQAADPYAPVEITVSDTVVAEDIEPLGANVTTLAGGTNLLTNNFIWGAGMEPGIARFLIRIERYGTDWMEWDQSMGGVHMWDLNATGFGDGATVRVYRIVDADGQPLSYGGGTELQDVTGADHVVFLGETVVPEGGWIAEGSDGDVNRVYLADDSLGLAYGDHAIITVTKAILTADEVHPRLHQWFDPNNGILNATWGGGATELVPHPGTLPPDFTEPGDTCLKITVSESGCWQGQYLFHGYDDGEGMWYSQLQPDASYRAEVWLRQEGVPGGAVRFFGAGAYSALTQSVPWTVTGEWQRYTYDFTGPTYPDPSSSHGGMGLEMAGPGTVWLDNFLVYRYDAAHNFQPFTPHHEAFDELMTAVPQHGKKPAIRFYTCLYDGHSSMQRLLSNYASSSIDFIYNIGAAHGQCLTVPQALRWTLATGDSPEDRCIPYLTLSEEYTEVEWLQLAEYLGVPYDPAHDTPAAKPWAYLRYRQRGTGRPWTDAFREIVIEFGNETWHAGVMAGWHGFGRPGWVHQGGREYGLFADYYFNQTVAAQPWWTQYNLGDKIKFALNANYDAQSTSYGELAAQQAPAVTSYLGHANYVGPKWETGDTPFEVFDDHGMQETLTGAYLGMFPLIEDIAAMRDQLAGAGLADYRPIAYEGGPSGYYLPGQGTPEQTAISQLYGKSLGMGVSALDAWLYCSLHGYSHQEMFAFAGGDNWKSHTMPRAGGFRRHTGWLALMLRNLYAPGDEMVEVSFQSIPSYEREGEDVPLMSAYAVKGTGVLSLFVLSRKLDGIHDGVDFGDGTTPVTIHLPFAECSGITRHALTAPDGTPADPRDSNLEAVNISITSLSLDPALIADGTLVIGPDSGGVAGGMPPGTVYLYTFQLGLAPPVLLHPADGSSALPTELSLQWQDCNDAPQEQGYEVRLAVAGGGYSYYSVGTDADACVVSGLQPGVTYVWNVRAQGDAEQGDSPWANGGTDFSFTTQTDDQALDLVFPADGQQGLPFEVLLQWTYTGLGGSGYEIRYKPEGGEYSYSSVPDPTAFYHALGPLTADTTYLWSVRTGSGKADWLPDRSFTTRGDGPGDVYLPYVREDGQYRTNAGFSNLSGDSRDVTARLYRLDGFLEATKAYTVPADGYKPVISIMTDMGAGITAGCMRFSSSGYINTIGGPVDNTSSDPSVTALAGDGTTNLLTPLVLQSGPWHTRIAVCNTTDLACACTFRFYSHLQQGVSHSFNQTIPARGAFVSHDIISDLGADPGAYGMLEVSGERGIQGFCHQYTDSFTGGIYPFYTETQASRVFYFPYVADTAAFRSNLGVVSTQAGSVYVTVELYQGGALDAVKSLYVRQGCYAPLHNVIRYLRDSSAMQNTEGIVKVTASQPVYVLGGTADNSSSDPGVTGGSTGLLSTCYAPVVLASGPWQTMVVPANFHDAPLQAVLSLKDPYTHDTMAETTVQVPAYDMVKIVDIIDLLGLAGDVYGRMEIDASLPVAAFVYHYTDSHAGGVYPVASR